MKPSFEGMWTLVRHFVRNLLRRDGVERDLSDEIDGYADLPTTGLHDGRRTDR